MSQIWVPSHRQDRTRTGLPTRNIREKHWGQAPKSRRHWALLIEFLLLNPPLRLVMRRERVWEAQCQSYGTAPTWGERPEVRKMLIHPHLTSQTCITYWGRQQWRINFMAIERHTMILTRITINNISKSCIQWIKTKPWKQTFFFLWYQQHVLHLER